ncbi:hypothetical protein AUC71_15635 [Methyloceanibacter marginalis]|uniref:Mce/MlaD domain-containing protein n=1 Tax=Methyloceanibacter marginalis TaxID=1774971 RepID=A0A1E3W9A6_9HYPH|nr:hypothetical protein AUC71_15635 [Methyloceanibacter marginalis]
METRARYALIGLFMLAVIAATFGFVYWLENKGGFGERETYRVQFESSVSGLLVGSAVLFNGIRVGDVTGIALNPAQPQQVIATIDVVKHTPIREDTRVNVEQQGLTGGVAITLTGGTSTAPLPADGGIATLIAPPGVGQDWTQSARDAFQQVETILNENAQPLNEAIENIEVFTDALARNADKVDGILAGIERMTGGGKGTAPLYSLKPRPIFRRRPRRRRTGNWSSPSRPRCSLSTRTRSSPSPRRTKACRSKMRGGATACRSWSKRSCWKRSRTPATRNASPAPSATSPAIINSRLTSGSSTSRRKVRPKPRS